jgi:hypothetical protein
VEVLREHNFECHFVATDGDSGMSVCHMIAWRLYHDFGGELAKIVPALIQRLNDLKK